MGTRSVGRRVAALQRQTGGNNEDGALIRTQSAAKYAARYNPIIIFNWPPKADNEMWAGRGAGGGAI